MLGLENPLHILIVLVVVLMVFGAKRLPEMGKSLGEGLHGFTRAIRGEQHTDSLAAAHLSTAVEPARVEPLVAAQTAGHAEV